MPLKNSNIPDYKVWAVDNIVYGPVDFQTLEACGFTRTILAGRADLIRRGGKGGIFRTADPDISFNFRAEGERRPVEVRIQTPVLEKIAAGDFTIPIEDFQEPLRGKWLGREIFVERGIRS